MGCKSVKRQRSNCPANKQGNSPNFSMEHSDYPNKHALSPFILYLSIPRIPEWIKDLSSPNLSSLSFTLHFLHQSTCKLQLSFNMPYRVISPQEIRDRQLTINDMDKVWEPVHAEDDNPNYSEDENPDYSDADEDYDPYDHDEEYYQDGYI